MQRDASSSIHIVGEEHGKHCPPSMLVSILVSGVVGFSPVEPQGRRTMPLLFVKLATTTTT